MAIPGMAEMIDVSALNSKIKFDKTDVPFEQREILGDATETGLARFAGRQLSDYDEHLKKHPKVFEVPFNSTNKWALVTGRGYSYQQVLSGTDLKSFVVLHSQEGPRRWVSHYIPERGSRACACEVLHLSEGWEADPN